MRLLVLAVGKAGPGPERDLIERYAERARRSGRALGFSRLDITEISESRAKAVEARKAAEAAALLGALPSTGAAFALDERGENVSSEAFARSLAHMRDRGAPALAFLIGGPDGHGAAALDRAERKIAFGAAVFPHLLIRVMLLEQIYRAMTILAGHPYHRI